VKRVWVLEELDDGNHFPYYLLSPNTCLEITFPGNLTRRVFRVSSIIPNESEVVDAEESPPPDYSGEPETSHGCYCYTEGGSYTYRFNKACPRCGRKLRHEETETPLTDSFQEEGW
jgi:hypothetical protein